MINLMIKQTNSLVTSKIEANSLESLQIYQEVSFLCTIEQTAPHKCSFTWWSCIPFSMKNCSESNGTVSFRCRSFLRFPAASTLYCELIPDPYSHINEYYSHINEYYSHINEYYSHINEYYSHINEYYSHIHEYYSSSIVISMNITAAELIPDPYSHINE